MTRVLIVRYDTDGTTVDGTAEIECSDDDEDGTPVRIGDFRDLDGEPLPLPPGSSFEVPFIGGDWMDNG